MPPVRQINLSMLKRKGSDRSDRECPTSEIPAKLEKINAGSKLPTAQKVSKIKSGKCCDTNYEAIEEKASGDATQLQECLQDNFFDVPCETLAKSLLGKILVRRLDSGHVLRGRIVETECYLGEQDKASHSYKGKMTERNSPMFMKPGTSYVYFTYGMYYCFNISSRGPGAAVLIRAVEPIEGLELMADLRGRGVKKKKKPGDEDQVGGGAGGRRGKPLGAHELCNGPSKLCIAMAIDKDSCNKRDLSTWPGLAVHEDPEAGAAPAAVVVSKRVGIESAGREWADKPLRFYLLDNTSVSKRDRDAERALRSSLNP